MIELTYKNCGSARQKLNGAAERFRQAEPRQWERFFDTANGKVFQTEKTIWRDGNAMRARAFIAMRPEARKALDDAARLASEKKCEIRMESISKHYFLDQATAQGLETHFMLVESAIPQNHVLLESQGQRLSDVDFTAFNGMFDAAMGERGIEAQLKVREMLQMIEQKMPQARGIPPKLTFRNKTLWTAGNPISELELDTLTKIIRANGLLGTSFGFIQRTHRGFPAYFEFHAHPSFLIPPSTGDILAASRDVFRSNADLKLLVQAVSIKIAESVHKMFISPYFRGEWNGWMDALAVRAGYLHQAYNEGKREVTGEAVKLLEHFIRAIPNLTESTEVVHGFERLRVQTKDGSGQKVLRAQWNDIVAAIRKAGPVEFASPEWEKSMWELSGGIARI